MSDASRTAIPTPLYRRDSTYAGNTQDVIRLIHEAALRGASKVEIRHQAWIVTVEWPSERSREEGEGLSAADAVRAAEGSSDPTSAPSPLVTVGGSGS